MGDVNYGKKKYKTTIWKKKKKKKKKKKEHVLPLNLTLNFAFEG